MNQKDQKLYKVATSSGSNFSVVENGKCILSKALQVDDVAYAIFCDYTGISKYGPHKLPFDSETLFSKMSKKDRWVVKKIDVMLMRINNSRSLVNYPICGISIREYLHGSKKSETV